MYIIGYVYIKIVEHRVIFINRYYQTSCKLCIKIIKNRIFKLYKRTKSRFIMSLYYFRSKERISCGGFEL